LLVAIIPLIIALAVTFMRPPVKGTLFSRKVSSGV